MQFGLSSLEKEKHEEGAHEIINTLYAELLSANTKIRSIFDSVEHKLYFGTCWNHSHDPFIHSYLSQSMPEDRRYAHELAIQECRFWDAELKDCMKEYRDFQDLRQKIAILLHPLEKCRTCINTLLGSHVLPNLCSVNEAQIIENIHLFHIRMAITNAIEEILCSFNYHAA